MTIAVGIDLVDVPRLRRMLEESTDPTIFLEMSWTAGEIEYCAGNVERLAARWAVKEAVFKALGVGIGPLSPLDVEVKSVVGKPRLMLHRGARERADELGLQEWSISMSHEQSMAIGMVIATEGGLAL